MAHAIRPVHTTPKEVENGNLTLKPIKCFHSAPWSTLHRRNLKTQQSPIILNLCLRKTGAEKSRDYRDVIVIVKLRFQNIFVVHTKTKSGRFQILPVRRAFLKISVFVTG